MRVSEDVLTVLDQAQTEGNRLVLVGQLDHKLYEKTNKVLEAAGGKWNRKEKAHIFQGDAADSIEQIILSGEIATHQEFDFFPTPPALVKRLLQLAQIQKDMTVLEPSAGTGNIAKEARGIGHVSCVELRAEYVKRLREVMGPDWSYVLVVDFLSVNPVPEYDRVVMNPPFSKQQDIKHVLHALKFLKPGGRLVSVMSASLTFRENKLTADFRALIQSRGGRIELNPDDAFKESGTKVRTVNVVIPN